MARSQKRSQIAAPKDDQAVVKKTKSRRGRPPTLGVSSTAFTDSGVNKSITPKPTEPTQIVSTPKVISKRTIEQSLVSAPSMNTQTVVASTSDTEPQTFGSQVVQSTSNSANLEVATKTLSNHEGLHLNYINHKILMF